MTVAKDNEDLTRVGPGTVMGKLMREYWLPALGADELKSDGAPVRLMLLGEKLIAFRDSSGRVGVMDHRCPHRCASLFFGRNEEDGIRCVYHGWKFDVDGNCIEMPNLPPSQDFKQKVKAKVYKASERNGLIWVYMGDARRAAAAADAGGQRLIPDGEAERSASCSASATGCRRWKATSTPRTSASCMPAASSRKTSRTDDLLRYTVGNRAPEYRVADTGWGTCYGAYRQAEGGETYWRFAQLHVSVLDAAAAGRTSSDRHPRPRLGADGRRPHDVHASAVGKTSATAFTRSRTASRCRASRRSSICRTRPIGTDAGGRVQTLDNDYLIDREAQQNGNLFRHRRRLHAGPGGDRKHGRNHRPRVRASGAKRSDDRARAPTAAARRPCPGGKGHATARRR